MSRPPRRAFAETVDPELYVPRAATDATLSALEDWIAYDGIGSSLALLMARPGLGKTLLLRLLEQRMNASALASEDDPELLARALYLPYAGLSLPDLCIWCHGLLGLQPGPPDARDHPVAALGALFQLGRGPDDPFFLIIDDADSMPAETYRALAQGLPRERSPLRIVMAIGDDGRASRMLAAFDPLQPLETALHQAMDLEETDHYLRARLAWAQGGSKGQAGDRDGDVHGDDGTPSAPIADLDAELVGRIHGLSGGNPRRLHVIASELLEAGHALRPSHLDDKYRRERWMGSPLEEDL